MTMIFLSASQDTFLSPEKLSDLLACFDHLCPPSDQTHCQGGTQPLCHQRGQDTAAFKVAPLNFPARWGKSVPIQQTGTCQALPGKASCFVSQAVF